MENSLPTDSYGTIYHQELSNDKSYTVTLWHSKKELVELHIKFIKVYVMFIKFEGRIIYSYHQGKLRDGSTRRTRTLDLYVWGTPRGFAIFFFLGGLFPTPELLIDLIYVFCYIFFYPYESKTTRFHNFYERFPESIERRIMDVIM